MPERDPAPRRRVAASAAPDPVRALLDEGKWVAALEVLEPRARSGDEAAKWLLAELVESLAGPQDARLHAGTILGEVGDPRPGVATLESAWCGPFPASAYLIGTQPDLYNDRTYTAQPVRLGVFQIARYPVTNAAYAYFVEAGGYQERRWWTEHGWQYLQPGSQHWFESTDERITQPRYWDDAQYNQPTQPVVGVTWYEASAYCAWLTEVGHTTGWLPPSDAIRLPSEAEWEVAAFWDAQAGQMVAWQPPDGEIWQNVVEAGIGRPSPVGMFPQGAVPCGALDMAGNVWEWCASHYGSYPQAAGAIEHDFRLTEWDAGIRGGAYYLQNICSSCGIRNWVDAYVRNNGLGFRVVWSLALIG